MQPLSELLGIPVIEHGSSFNLSNRHPLDVTGASADVLKDADLVVAVGVKDIEAVLKRPAPEAGVIPSGLPTVRAGHGRRSESLVAAGTKLVRVGLQEYAIKSWNSAYGRLVPADVAILGNGAQVLRELARSCESAISGDLERRIAERTARAREIYEAVDARVQKDVKEHWRGQKPISTARLAAELWEAIRGEDWILVHGSLSGWERRVWDMAERSRCIAGGGGTGTGMGVAMGVVLAFQGNGQSLREHPERR